MYDLYQYKHCDLEEYGYCPDVSMDRRVFSLIEELYNSKSLNKSAIAEALNWMCYEILPEDKEDFHPEDINLVYHDDFAKTFSHWIDCIDDATGYLNYHKLLMGCTQEKKISTFSDTGTAMRSIVLHLTSCAPFDESMLAGALIFLAKLYGVKHDEVIYTNSNVKRK